MKIPELRKNIEPKAAGFVILAIAVFLRMSQLLIKAPHFDEGINGWFVNQVWKTGFYHYDPSNYHGPLYFYLLQISETVLGRGIWANRFITACFSAGSVLVIFSLRRFIGRAALWAALALALSPGSVFYGRYAIHESVFIFFQLCFLSCVLNQARAPKFTYLNWLGLCLVAQLALKETTLIVVVTMMIAWLCAHFLVWPLPKLKIKGIAPREFFILDEGQHFLVLSISLLALLALFSGFCAEPQGVSDFFRAYAFWAKTGVGQNGHDKPFGYWFELFRTHEWLSLIGLAAALWQVFDQRVIVRWLAWVTIGVFLAYSLIPYKTPWCILGLIWPSLMSFGFAVEQGIEKLRKTLAAQQLRIKQAALLVFFTTLAAVYFKVGQLSWDLNFVRMHDLSDPYVYVQSTPDILDLKNYLEARVQVHPAQDAMKIWLPAQDIWPLPWYLEDFSHLVYADVSSARGELPTPADVILADENQKVLIENMIRRPFWRSIFRIRDARASSWLYVAADSEFAPQDFFKNAKLELVNPQAPGQITQPGSQPATPPISQPVSQPAFRAGAPAGAPGAVPANGFSRPGGGR